MEGDFSPALRCGYIKRTEKPQHHPLASGPALLIAPGAAVLIHQAILPRFILLLGSFQAEGIVSPYRKTFGLK